MLPPLLQRRARSLVKADMQEYKLKWEVIRPSQDGCDIRPDSEYYDDATDHPFMRLSKLVKQKYEIMQQQFKGHYESLSLYSRLDFLLTTHSMRYAISRKGWKVRQMHDNIDMLFAHATLINVPFQMLISSILSRKLPATGYQRMRRGPVKRPHRSLEKVMDYYFCSEPYKT
jgi:hypothetical protein